MIRKKKFEHEWHLYSLAVMIILSAFFFYTAFNVFWASVGWGIIVAMSGLMAASPNWKDFVSPDSHKAFMLMIIVGAFLWSSYLFYKNKMIPYLSKKGVSL